MFSSSTPLRSDACLGAVFYKYVTPPGSVFHGGACYEDLTPLGSVPGLGMAFYKYVTPPGPNARVMRLTMKGCLQWGLK
jgi:hypothetical protein